MNLTVPHRTVADTGSFPVNPDQVAQWLESLHPLDSEADAREVYRGLKHSNRLHNDVDRRRAVISCFIPVLRELHTQLTEICLAQPLPLTREAGRYARLQIALLREEAFTFKLLLTDSDKPLPDDARRAMQALARQAESLAHAYRPYPSSLMHDAHQLYTLAEEHRILAAGQSTELVSLLDHYRFILLASISQLWQQRARQLPLVLEFLKRCTADIHIDAARELSALSKFDRAVDLHFGSRVEPAQALLTSERHAVRYFTVSPLLIRIDQESSRLRSGSTSLLGSDTLERQSLARLHLAVSRSRHRRSARCINNLPVQVVFGHKEICAHLLYQNEEPPKDEEHAPWVSLNTSNQGMCLQCHYCRAGQVQVGELISVCDPSAPLEPASQAENSKVNTLLGVVRWMHAQEEERLTIGVEFLARSVLPVIIARDEMEHHSAETLLPDTAVPQHALIIACKVQKSVLQTMLLPSYLFQSGERLTARQGVRSRRLQLKKCLQANGLFSQFSLLDGEVS